MTITIPTLDALPAAAAQFIGAIGTRRLFALYGPMGAGKTTFVKAVCEQLGVTDVVASPTFAIVNEYGTPSGRPVYHFDFYRIRRLTEVYDLGYEDYFYGPAQGLCFMEWPELVEELLPDDVVRVTIAEQSDGTRQVTFDE